MRKQVLLTCITISCCLLPAKTQNNDQKVLQEVIINGIQKFVFEYDEQLNTTFKKEYERAKKDDDWELTDQENYTWHQGGKLKSKEILRLNSAGEMVPSFKQELSHSNDQLNRKKMYRYENGKWNLNRQSVYHYTGDKLTEVEYFKKESEKDEFELLMKEVFSYNGNGQKILKEAYSLDGKGENLIMDKKIAYAYKNGQLAQKVTHRKISWGERKDEWTPSRKMEYKYQPEGSNQTIRYRFNEEIGKWEAFTRQTDHYAENDKKQYQLMERFNDGTWEPYIKTRFHYADDDAKVVMPYLEQERGENPFGFDTGMVETIERLRWNGKEQQWETKETITFVWTDA